MGGLRLIAPRSLMAHAHDCEMSSNYPLLQLIPLPYAVVFILGNSSTVTSRPWLHRGVNSPGAIRNSAMRGIGQWIRYCDLLDQLG